MTGQQTSRRYMHALPCAQPHNSEDSSSIGVHAPPGCAVHSTPGLYVLILITGFALSGCYHYRVVTPDPPATEYNRKTLHAMFWGLSQHDADVGDCVSNALVEVRVRNNVGYMFLSALTLGIWVPLDVEWRCAKLPAVEDEL